MTMKLHLAVLCLAYALPQEPARDPDGVELRLYVIDKEKRPVDLTDAAAGIVIVPKDGKGRTRAMELVTPKDASEPETRHQVRELEGSAYFADFIVSRSARQVSKGLPPPAKEEESLESLLSKSNPPPAPKPDEKERNGHRVREPAAAGNGHGPPLSLAEWVRQVYAGPFFRVRIPANEAPAAFTAAVTVRLKTQSFTARGFTHPFEAEEKPGAVFGRIEEGLKEILRLVDAVDFRKIPPVTVRLREDLAKLSAYSLPDPKGEFEYARVWCDELAKKLDSASRTGEEDIPTLVARFNLKFKVLKAALEQEKTPNSQPPTPHKLPAPNPQPNK